MIFCVNFGWTVENTIQHNVIPKTDSEKLKYVNMHWISKNIHCCISPYEIPLIKGDAADNTFSFYEIYLNKSEDSEKTDFSGDVSLDISYSVGNLTEWIEYENRTIRLNNTLDGLDKRDRKEFLKQYDQAYINREIDNTLPGLDVWGIGTETTGRFNK